MEFLYDERISINISYEVSIIETGAIYDSSSAPLCKFRLANSIKPRQSLPDSTRLNIIKGGFADATFFFRRDFIERGG